MRKNIFIIVMVIILLLAPIYVQCSIAEDKNNILIVSSYSNTNKWANEFISTLISQLDQDEIEVHYRIDYINKHEHSNAYEYVDVVKELEGRYQDANLDSIVVLGAEALYPVATMNFVVENNIPILTGGVNLDYIDAFPWEEYGMHRPEVEVKSSLDGGEYLQNLMDIQPKLEKLYFLSLGEPRSLPLLRELQEACREQGIVSEEIALNQLASIDFRNDGIEDNREALVVGSNHWWEDGEVIDPLAVFSDIRQYYVDPIYWLNHIQFQCIADEWGGKYPVTGTISYDIHKECERIIGNIRAIFAEQEGVEVVNGHIGDMLLNYNGIKGYALYNESLEERYELINFPDNVIYIPREVGIVSLAGIGVLIFIVILLLRRRNQQNERLLQQVASRKARYERVLALLPDAIITVEHGKVTYINAAGARLLEGEKTAIEGTALARYSKGCKVWENQPKQNQEKKVIYTYRGNQREVEISYLHYPFSELTELIMLRDMTEERKLRDQIEEQKLRTEFFSTLSHELRTPVNVILSTSHLIDTKESTKNDSKIQQYNQIIQQNSYRLARLINNLIDSTKVEAGFLQLDLKKDNLVELTEYIVSSVLPFANMKKIKLIFDTDEEELYSSIDHDKYERIILNLLSNGIKYNYEYGEIFVGLYPVGQYNELIIRDNGMGIPLEKQEEIFTPFVQVSSTETAHIEGSGIGLSIVKAFVELHGGEITLDSIVGKYTEFRVLFPVVEVNEEERLQINTKRRYGTDGVQVELADIPLEVDGDF